MSTSVQTHPLPKIRLVIVDDHPLFRQGLRQVIEADERFELVAEADHGHHALDIVRTRAPDLVVLDIGLPDINGLELAVLIQALKLPTRLVILTMFKDEASFNKALNLGIQGYVLKENAVSEIISCLVSVAKDVPYVSPSLTNFMLRRRAQVAELINHKPGLDDLTVAERRILRRIADKKTTKEIAAELSVSPRTVESHRANICTKLALKGGNSLLQFALENRTALADL